MADLDKSIRLAVDTGKVALGSKEVMKALCNNAAKLVIVASRGEKDAVMDILHACSIANIKAIKREGGSAELGTVCGKPYPVSAMAIIDEGHSNIVEEVG